MWSRSRPCKIRVRRARQSPAIEVKAETLRIRSCFCKTPPPPEMRLVEARRGPQPLRKESMHRLMAGVTILEHELSELRLLVERQTGILLDCPNSALAAHVADYLESHELESVAGLIDRLRSADRDPSIFCTFLDGVLNVRTGFFRHPGAMNALARQVMPQLYARKSDEDRKS